MMHLLIPLLEKSAPYLAAAISTASPLAGLAVNAIAKTFGGDVNDIPALVDSIKGDSNGNSKLQILDSLLGAVPQSLTGQRLPSKIDIRIVLDYPGEAPNVGNQENF